MAGSGASLPYKFAYSSGQLPNKWIKITSKKTGKSVVAPIVDVGPHVTNNPYWESPTGDSTSGDKENKAGLASETTLDLESVCKYSGEKPLVHENAGKTIAGFTASNVRVNYKINLIWIGHNNEILVDQNLNLRIADMLKKLRFKMPFDPTGFFLDKIIDRTLYIGYDTDSTKDEFKFQVDVAQDGGMRINPESIKMN